MVNDVRPLAAVKRGDCGYRSPGPKHPVAAAAPWQRMQPEPLGADRLTVISHACCDDDLEPGIAGSAGHRQPVRAEVPILGDQEDELWPPPDSVVRSGRIRGCRYI